MAASTDDKQMRVAAVIVAAGRGERAGQSVEGPKQYRKIGGEAVLAHTLRAFLGCPFINHVVVVIHKEDEGLFAQAAGDYAAQVTCVTGGPTRQESTRLGLLALKDQAPDHVLIHDGVRPFIAADLLERVIFNLTPHIGVLPVLAVSDTLKAAGHDAMVSATIPRAGLYAAQTPQAFPMVRSWRRMMLPSPLDVLISPMILPSPNGRVYRSVLSKVLLTIQNSPGQRISIWLMTACPKDMPPFLMCAPATVMMCIPSNPAMA